MLSIFTFSGNFRLLNLLDYLFSLKSPFELRSVKQWQLTSWSEDANLPSELGDHIIHALREAIHWSSQTERLRWRRVKTHVNFIGAFFLRYLHDSWNDYVVKTQYIIQWHRQSGV